MQTIAQQLNIKEFPFTIQNSKGYEIYFENSDSYWAKQEYDTSNNVISFKNSDGYWWKREYDKDSNEIFYQNSMGNIIDNRPKIVVTLQEIADKFGVNINNLKIK